MLVGILLVCGRARATSRDDEAKQHYLNGFRAYNLAHYDEAIAEYEKAYGLRDDPAFLFNIAQAHRLAGHPEQAARFYRTYLRLDPRSPQRTEIRARIAEMDAAAQTQQRQPLLPPQGTFAPSDVGSSRKSSSTTASLVSATTGPAAAETETAKPEADKAEVRKPSSSAPRGTRPWFPDPVAMSLAGAGIVAVGVGVGLVSYGSVVTAQASSATTAIDDSRLLGEAKRLYVVGGVVLGAGVALGVGAVVKWLVGRPVPVAVVAGPGYAGAILTRSF